MRYELQIVTADGSIPEPEELAERVATRGGFRPWVVTSVGYERAEDSPRILLEEQAGARILVAAERGAAATEVATAILAAPPALLERLETGDRRLLETARATYRLSVNRPGSNPANAVRFQVHVADALLDRAAGVTLDPEMQLVWGSDAWRAARELGELDVRRHVVIHAEPLPAGKVWLHTHGLIKFGRPDLEMSDVAEAQVESRVMVLNEVARHLSHGGELALGEEALLGPYRVRAAPAGIPPVESDLDNDCVRIDVLPAEA